MNELTTTNDMNISDMTQLARAVATSKLFGMQTAEQALVLMALCRSEGKDPIQAVRQYHIINGKPAMRADAMLAEFQARGGTVEWGERTSTVVSGTFAHPSGGRLTVTWTIKDAQEAQLTGNPTWKKFPRQMLTARVISEAIRTILPGVVAGIYTPEEVHDFAEPMVARPVPALPKASSSEDTPKASVSVTPSIDPRGEFIALAAARGHDVMSEGKPSKSKIIALLDIVFGTTDATWPVSVAGWESALAALEVHITAEDAGSVVAEAEVLGDPFADEEGS